MMRLAAAAVIAVVALVGRPAEACVPAMPAEDPGALPAPWRVELEALVAASGDASQPWGCPDATIVLAPNEVGALMRVERRGAKTMERHLEGPFEVVPVGKAMLARPAVATPAPGPEPGLSSLPLRGPDVVEEPDDAPTGYLDGTGTARYMGGTGALAAGAGLRATLPVGPWRVALGARYTSMISGLANTANELAVSTLAVGGFFSYELVTDPVRLDLGVMGGLAVVSMETEGRNLIEDFDDVESSMVDGRFGLEGRLMVPVVSIMSLLVAAGVELSPGSLADTGRTMDPLLPPIPAYTLGLDVGAEVAIP